MESSAAKRRKTSPSTALQIRSTTPTPTPPGPPPPLVLPPTDAPRGTEPRSTRSSYASPTKASLSKHNPDILQRRPTSPTKARGAGEGPGDLQTDALLQGQLEEPSPRPDRQLREDHERATSLYQRSDARPSRSPTRQLGGGLAARPRRTPVKPNPRPLPPPGPDDDDDAMDPFAGRVLRRSPLGGPPEPDPPEPELPPTPVHPDYAASTPPTGIHSTPSKRPRKSRALAERLRSSPTKQPPSKAATNVLRRQDEHILPTTESEPLRTVTNPRAMQKDDVKVVHSRTRSRPRPSDVRGVETVDAENVAKRRERDALLREIGQLEGDLKVVVQENERIRDLQLSGKDARPAKDTIEVFDVLKRHMGARSEKASTDSPMSWVQAALDPMAFLPFGKPSSAIPTWFPEDTSAMEPEPDLISHYPLTLTAPEALPFLQAFTPLKFTSRITILPSSAGITTDGDDIRIDRSLRQHHSITAASASADGLFSARIEMTVNAVTHAITSLTVPSIDPPAAAAELSQLTSKVLAEPQASSSALSRNVGVLTWAMGSWLRSALRRAKIWRTLDRELGTVEGVVRTVARVRAASKSRRRRRKAGRGTEEDVSEAREKDADTDDVADWLDSMVDSDDLLPYMGRLWMDFRIPSLSAGGVAHKTDTEVSVLRVQWRIEFDWTGEAACHIRALATLPAKCKSCFTSGDVDALFR